MGMVYSVQQKRGEGCSTGAGGFSQRMHLTYTITPLYVQGKKNFMFTRIKHSSFVADFIWS